MRVLQILLLTVGLVLLGNILGRVSAQTKTKSANSNIAANRAASNIYSNYGDADFARNTNLPVQNIPYPKDEDLEVNSDDPTILKQIAKVRTYNFPVNGQVKIEIIEEYYEPFVVKFTQLRSDKFLGSFKLLDGEKEFLKRSFISESEPFAELIPVNIEGFPSPMVHLVLTSPTDTGGIFLSVLFGEVNGKIKLLTPLNLMHTEKGGIHFGQLGQGNEVGLAVWDYVLGDENDSHRYEVEFFSYDAKLAKFVNGKKLVTKNKYADSTKALAELGLSFFKNSLDEFTELDEYRKRIQN